MKAIVVHEFGAPEVMTLEERPAPTPGPDQILVRVKAAGVNPVDTYIRAGTYARKPSLPYTPGMDLGGVVEAVGTSISAFKPGDRVYTHGAAAGFGAYGEQAVCDLPQVHPLSERASFAQGAALGVPYGTAWRALLMKAHARPGETVFVNGASGGVGVAAVQIARAHGLTVIGTAGTEKGMTLVREQGAEQVVNHHDPAYMQQVMDITRGRGADIIIEMLANVNLDRALDVLAPRGRLVVVGNRGRVEIDPRKIMSRDGTVVGMTMFNATAEELREAHAGIAAGLQTGALAPVVRRELPLGDAAEAHRMVMEPGAFGKIVLVP